MKRIAMIPDKVCMIISFILLVFTVNAQVVFQAGNYQIDENLKLIICNKLPDPSLPSFTTITLDKTYSFQETLSNVTVGNPYSVNGNGTEYTLYFTRIPLVSIAVADKNAINSDNEIGGAITVADTIGSIYTSNMGIKIRGGVSAGYTKKSYKVELWADAAGTETDASLLGMRNDQKWLLLALYNEKLRINNVMSHALWLKIHTPYYAASEPDALPGIRTRYAELLLNGAYQGIYAFAEDLDRKQLKLKKEQDNQMRGELYKGNYWGGANTFSQVPALSTATPEDWGGWEPQYPDMMNWTNIYNFTQFIVNSSDADFNASIASKFKISNAIDYFIFLNLLFATDNSGKNLFIAKYKENEPYFFAPWDLDGTWGYIWTGEQTTNTTDILTNGLYNRLLNLDPNGFKNSLATRWFSLRLDLLAINNLKNNFYSNHSFLLKNDVYTREALAWPNDFAYDPSQLDHLTSWTESRVAYLDSYFRPMLTAALRVQLTYFDAKANHGKTSLLWNTSFEENNKGFEIERSTDGLNFTKIGQISSQATEGNSSRLLKYAFTDEIPLNGVNYYRLKQIDFDGKFEYSPIRSVNHSAFLSAAFPNPVKSHLFINDGLNPSKEIWLYTLSMQLLYHSQQTTQSINMEKLPEGIYLLKTQKVNGEVITQKIIKQ